MAAEATAGGDLRGDWAIPASELATQRDLRAHRIFTIDPATARDLDDALHVTPMPDGTVELGVHIADVSHFVRPGSAVDGEAQVRATSVYLVHSVIPMLPSVLCEDLCSLNPSVERLAFSCVWRMTSDGGLCPGHTPWFGKSVIRSCAKLDYGTAQKMVDGGSAWPANPFDGLSPPGASDATKAEALAALISAAAAAAAAGAPGGASPLCGPVDGAALGEGDWEAKRRPTGGHTLEAVIGDVRLMHALAMARRKRRFAAGGGGNGSAGDGVLLGGDGRAGGGALSLHKVKLCFEQDRESGDPTRVFSYPFKDTNKLVEEYMLLANFLVAQHLLLKAGPKALVRCHPKPVQRSLDALQPLVEKLMAAAAAPGGRSGGGSGGAVFDCSSAGALHHSLRRLEAALERCAGSAAAGRACAAAVTTLLTHPMKPAAYMAAGADSDGAQGGGSGGDAVTDAARWRHYALNIPYYTHFTSPIRRYADVMVHRLLHAVLLDEQAASSGGGAGAGGGGGGGGGGSAVAGAWGVEQVQEMAAKCNEMKDAAKNAQERSDHVYLCVFLRNAGPLEADAVVIGVGAKSFTIFVPELGLEGRVFVDQMGAAGGQQVAGAFDEASEVLTLTRPPSAAGGGEVGAGAAGGGWTELQLEIFAMVRVAVRCRPKPPLDLDFDVVHLAAPSPLARLTSRRAGDAAAGSSAGASTKPPAPLLPRAAAAVLTDAAAADVAVPMDGLEAAAAQVRALKAAGAPEAEVAAAVARHKALRK